MESNLPQNDLLGTSFRETRQPKECILIRLTHPGSCPVLVQAFQLATDSRLGKHPSELPDLPARKRQALAPPTREYELRPRAHVTEPEPFPLRTEVTTRPSLETTLRLVKESLRVRIASKRKGSFIQLSIQCQLQTCRSIAFSQRKAVESGSCFDRGGTALCRTAGRRSAPTSCSAWLPRRRPSGASGSTRRSPCRTPRTIPT